MKKTLFGFIFLAIVLIGTASSVYAAVIEGNAFDGNFTPLKNVIVEIQTHPKQIYVAKDGYYRFDLTDGRYSLMAFHDYNGTVYFTQKEVLASGASTYKVDLILDQEFNGTLPEVSEGFNLLTFLKNNFVFILIILGFIILIGVGLFVFAVMKNRPKVPDMVPELAQVLDFVKKQGGRTTQKDLRQSIGILSEAKISLMVAELEEKCFLEKIKKGRGNIIVLKK